MAHLSRTEIERYLKSVIAPSAHILDLKVLGESEEKDIKGYGYGTPVKIDYECEGKQRHAVLHTISPGPFGHEHMADRAQMLLWDHSTFNRLPRHVHSIDVGAFRRDGSTVSLGDAEEFFVLTEYAEGRGYVEDVTRMRDDSRLTETLETLVMAHPIWYPNLANDVRQKLFNFIHAVLDRDVFDPAEVNHYCGA